MSRRVVVEINSDLHRELRKIAVINDLKLYTVANALLQDCLSDEEHVKTLLRRLRM